MIYDIWVCLKIGDWPFLENIPVLKKTRFPSLDGLFSSGISQLATFDFLRLNIRVDHGLSLTWSIQAKPPPHLSFLQSQKYHPPKRNRRNGLTKKKLGFLLFAYLKPSKFYDHPGVAEARPPRGSQGLEPSQPSLQKPRPQWVQLSLVASDWCLATGWYMMILHTLHTSMIFLCHSMSIIPVWKRFFLHKLCKICCNMISPVSDMF